MRLAAFNGPSPKIPLQTQKSRRYFYTSQVIISFVPNFVAMATGVGRGKCNWQDSMAYPRKPPYRRKNLAKISYASRVKANFVSNFVAMATGVGRERCSWQHSMAHPRKPPYMRKNLLRKPSYSQFCPKFRCHGNQGRSRVKLNDTVRFAIPENHTLEPKITTLSYTQPKL